MPEGEGLDGFGDQPDEQYTTGTPGETLGDPFQLAPAPVARTQRSSAAPDSRFSLAFELAAAMEPNRPETSDLLEQLGIETPDAKMIGSEEATYEASGVSEPGSPPSSWSGLSPSHFHSPRYQPSLASLMTSPGRSLSGSGQSESGVEDDFDISFESAASALEASLTSTDLFLSNLRNSTTDSKPASEVTGGQPAVESLTSNLVKGLQSATRDREGQIRELCEVERELSSRTDSEWLSSLAALDHKSVIDSPSSSPTTANGLISIYEDDDEAAEPTTPKATRHMAPSLFVNADSTPRRIQQKQKGFTIAPTELASLRKLTTALVETLSAINEHTQVHRAAHGEAGRKLKVLKSALSAWKSELEDTERSQQYIDTFEKERGSERFRDMAQREKRKAEEALEQAAERAHTLLTVAA